MTRTRTTAVAVVVMSLAAISAGAWGLSRWRPLDHEPATVAWPENVQPIVDYIEQETDLRFLSAIDFEYIGDDDRYNDRVRDPEQELSQADRDGIAVDEAVGRALGVWADDASLTESYATVNRAAPRPVRWLPDSDVVIINASDEQATLSPAVRADLVVYLTQAVADQNFHLIKRREASTTSQGFDAVASVHIGYALLIHDRYVDDLSSRDRELYEAESAEQSEAYANSVDSVPASYKAIRIAFQVLGAAFMTTLAEDDPALLLQALSTQVPVALDQVSLPTAKYLRNDALESVAAPSGPRGATVHYREQLGPFRLFLMFAAGLPTNEALTAADGWGNDRYTAYELDGRECADIHIVADSPADADRMERALNRWAFTRPSSANALVGRDGVNLYASVCDPGADSQQTVPGDDAINQYFGRSDFLQYQATSSGKPALAECIATDLYAQFTFEQIASETPNSELEAAYVAIEDECRNSI
ncbi:MAG: hypothetical protein K8R99_07695 [Actinomycetia bacterium]|nr:hypothetical protein [Actinomycetes bacterium]